MALLILLVTFLFTIASFFVELPKNSSGTLTTYLSTEFYYILSNLFIFYLGFVVLTGITYFTHKFAKNLTTFSRIKFSFLHIGQIFFLSFFLSYITLFILALLQLNFTAISMNINPGLFGVKTNADEILSTLKLRDSAPKLVFAKSDENKTAVAVAQANSGNNNFYGKIVLPSIPNMLIIPTQNEKSSLTLIGDTLVFSKISFDTLEEASPIIAHLFVKEYFGNKFVKFYPRVSIMDNDEYKEYRKLENEKKIKKIDNHLITITQNIATISAAIANDKFNIEQVKASGSATVKDSDQQYQRCIKYYEISGCEKIKSQLSKKEMSENPRLAEWEKQLEFDESLQRAYLYYEKFYKTQKAILVKNKNTVSDEHGVFEPEKLIKVKIEEMDEVSLSEYFTVLIHEYFHYASFQKDKKFSNLFFEEALTEYFARQVIEHNLDIRTNLGYPIQAKIIEQISNRIAENELISIYFSKDDAVFGQALDRVYGDGFY